MVEQPSNSFVVTAFGSNGQGGISFLWTRSSAQTVYNADPKIFHGVIIKPPRFARSKSPCFVAATPLPPHIRGTRRCEAPSTHPVAKDFNQLRTDTQSPEMVENLTSSAADAFAFLFNSSFMTATSELSAANMRGVLLVCANIIHHATIRKSCKTKGSWIPQRACPTYHISTVHIFVRVRTF